MSYELEFDLDTNFTFPNTHVYTISQDLYDKYFPYQRDLPIKVFGVDLPAPKKRKTLYPYLIIDSTFDLEAYDSLVQGSAKIRPQLLVIHGILSFLTNEVFTSFQNAASIQTVVKHHIEFNPKKQSLVINKVDCSSDLNKIISTIINSTEDKKTLLYTLLERWRKALFFEVENEDSFMYDDESALAYIHVLEVLSDEFKTALSLEIKEKKKEIITEIIKCTSLNDSVKLKKIASLLNQINRNQVTLKSKVLTMLKELGLYNLKSEAIVNRFIEHRNAIAHGRKNLYQDKVVFPLRPFFSFIKDIDENLEAIKILSAKTISTYLGLDAWDEDWELLLITEFTPISLVNEFILNEKYKSLNEKQLINGKIDGVNPATLAYYCIKGKVKIDTLENILFTVITTSKITKANLQALFSSSVLLSDSLNQKLAKKAQNIITTVHEKKWGYYSNIRDILKELEYQGITLKWFATWLSSR